MTSQHRDIMMTLDRFFADETNFKKLESLLSRNKRRVSLRLLHFTAQNAHKLTKRPELANRYQTTLESAGKKYFDAFRRHSRFNYELDGNKVETNAAQLRFIKYIIENWIVEWLEDSDNRKRAEKSMKDTNAKLAAARPLRKTSKKRKTSSSAAVGFDKVKLPI